MTGFPLVSNIRCLFFSKQFRIVSWRSTSVSGIPGSPSSHFPQDLEKLSMPHALRATIIDPGANNVGVSSKVHKTPKKTLNVWVVYPHKDRIGGKCR